MSIKIAHLLTRVSTEEHAVLFWL